jgi:prevent-host-death family protein
MQHSVRTISSSDAKANLSDVLSSLNTQGPVEITRNGKAVGLLTLPPVQSVDRGRIAVLAIAYSKGLISWPQIAEETGASYGDVLIALGLNNLRVPKVTPKNRPEQIALFHCILDLASTESKGTAKS